jgi:hypothetical protein
MLLLLEMIRVVVMIHYEIPCPHQVGTADNLVLPTHPGLQVPNALAPSTQAGPALGKAAADVLHAPQWATLVLRFTSQPLTAMPSQSLNLQGEGCKQWYAQAHTLHAAGTEVVVVMGAICTHNTVAYPPCVTGQNG